LGEYLPGLWDPRVPDDFGKNTLSEIGWMGEKYFFLEPYHMRKRFTSMKLVYMNSGMSISTFFLWEKKMVLIMVRSVDFGGTNKFISAF
jgi:hypothetical protein